MDWSNWCRLCGNYESILKIETEIKETAASLKHFIIDDTFKICVECNSFLSEIQQFVTRSKLVDAMFLELEQFESLAVEEEKPEALLGDDLKVESNEILAPPLRVLGHEQNINSVRHKFGLKTLESAMEEEFASILDESHTTGALEIKLESEIAEFEATDAFSEGQDDHSESSEEEEESETEDIEQLSDSQLRRHEDSLQLQEESSDSDLEQQPRRRKKYRKSDDEKLFDFICHVCQEEFQKMSLLSKHCRRVHNCLPAVNCFCGKQLGTWKRLLIHKQLHFPEKIDYECKECKLTYKLRTSYETHMKTKHGPDAKKFVCSQCARCFKDSRTLGAHEKTHLPDYLKLTHPCDICNKKFVNKNSLKSHITSVHEMANLYTCETCGKGFSTKSNLKSHLYVHSSKKDVQCDTCSARFKNMDSLRKHKKTHLEKSFSCPMCHQRYRNRNNLKAHMVCHSDIKAFQCSFCPNSYKRSKDLKCHLNLHTGDRPYQCQFCSRTFVNGSNCRKHKLKDHPEELSAFEAMHGRGKSAVQALHVTS